MKLQEDSMQELSPRENYLRALRHEETEYVPLGFSCGDDVALVGVFSPTDVGQEASGFMDGYGVRWVATSEAAIGKAIPEPGNFILKDVTKWKSQITIPDIKNYDWEKIARAERAAIPADRGRQVFVFLSSNSVWERLAALMGFEEAMVALVEEPDATNELFTAITDYKIQLAEAAATYFQADAFMHFDDIATERNLFMSPATYRKLIKPHHKRLNDAVRNFGMIPIQHTCGYAELCVEDYIETGADAWNSVQPSNDIAALLDKYGSKLVFEGGYDTTGKPGQSTATVEEIEAEVERCFREYGSKKGFVFFGVLVPSAGNSAYEAQMATMLGAAKRLRYTKGK
jgi:uroporphyrinogen-III decarboxylase